MEPWITIYTFLKLNYKYLVLRLVELIKESCVDYEAKLSDRIKTRLYSPSARRYICFNRKGKIRTMVSLNVYLYILHYSVLFNSTLNY